MTDELSAALESALARLEQLKKRKRAPSRFEARKLLLALGALLLEERDSEVAQVRERLERALRDVSEPWELAVNEELQLAGMEHMQGVDPRHLDHPSYDFEYTVEARRRLEMRLAALDTLGLTAPADLLSRIAQADAMLEPYLRARGGRPNPN
jgi:hypothetical protein